MSNTETTLKPRIKMTTTLGEVTLELDGEQAPISVQNFVQYATDGYYEGTIFHRVIPGFMVQGGGFNAEMIQQDNNLRPPIKNEWTNDLKNGHYTLAMARLGGDADSATAQFFINVSDNGFLDQPQPDGAAYAVFGRVTEGTETVDAIEKTPVATHPKYPSPDPVTPREPVIIQKMEMLDTFDSEAAQKIAAETKEPKGIDMEDFIKNLESETGKETISLDSGLKYLVLEAGEGECPATTDTVEVHYRGTLVTGEEFDSSYSRGETASFPLNQVIPAWTEGVSLMKPGAKHMLICPPDLAYGNRPLPGIPAGSTLIFQVELINVL